jgi:hypothetical protein
VAFHNKNKDEVISNIFKTLACFRNLNKKKVSQKRLTKRASFKFLKIARKKRKVAIKNKKKKATRLKIGAGGKLITKNSSSR